MYADTNHTFIPHVLFFWVPMKTIPTAVKQSINHSTSHVTNSSKDCTKQADSTPIVTLTQTALSQNGAAFSYQSTTALFVSQEVEITGFELVDRESETDLYVFQNEDVIEPIETITVLNAHDKGLSNIQCRHIEILAN